MKSKYRIRFLLVSSTLIVLIAGFIKPVDRTHFLDTSYYHKAQEKLDSLKNHSSTSQPSQLIHLVGPSMQHLHNGVLP